MNTTFSFKRLGLLLKRFFIENKTRELTFWAIMILIFAISRSNITFNFMLVIAGFIFAARQMNYFAYSPRAMHFLLIPATHTEKLTANILITTVYFFVAMIVSFIIGNFVGTYLYNLIFGMHLEPTWNLFDAAGNSIRNENNIQIFWGPTGFLKEILGFATTQAIFTVGALYFNRNSVVKTFLSLFTLGFVLFLIELLVLRIVFNSFSIPHSAFHEIALNNIMIGQSPIFNAFKIIVEVIVYLFLPFLWIVGYFRLTEKQV